ncbi:hypothetical protein I4U23_013518 [Adineta vaga]|nr:hypothetical protein I4U23_013518 [Adineta vaga]
MSSSSLYYFFLRKSKKNIRKKQKERDEDEAEEEKQKHKQKKEKRKKLGDYRRQIVTSFKGKTTDKIIIQIAFFHIYLIFDSMFACWYLGLIGYVFVNIAFCQDGNPPSIDGDNINEPDVTVHLSIETKSDSRTANTNNEPPQKQVSDLFSCHECTNCASTSESNIRSCAAGVNVCYKSEDKNKVIRRGCAAPTGRCNIPDGDQSNRFETVTCCTTTKCNQSIQLKPFFFLSILGFLTMMIINI